MMQINQGRTAVQVRQLSTDDPWYSYTAAISLALFSFAFLVALSAA